MRLIDADELKRYVDIFNVACGCNDNEHQKEILEAIDDQPTVELSEVQNPRQWIQKCDEDKNEIISCLNCEHTAALELDNGEILYECTCDDVLPYMLDEDHCKYFRKKENGNGF